MPSAPDPTRWPTDGGPTMVANPAPLEFPIVNEHGQPVGRAALPDAPQGAGVLRRAQPLASHAGTDPQRRRADPRAERAVLALLSSPRAAEVRTVMLRYSEASGIESTSDADPSEYLRMTGRIGSASSSRSPSQCSTASVTAQTTRATRHDRQTTPHPEPALRSIAEVQQLYAQAESRDRRVHVPVPVPVDEFLARFDPKRPRTAASRTRRGCSCRRRRRRRSVQVAPGIKPHPAPVRQRHAQRRIRRAGAQPQRRRAAAAVHRSGVRARSPLIVNVDDEQATTARIVGADRQTALTVVRLAEAGGRAVAKFSKSRPPPGR